VIRVRGGKNGGPAVVLSASWRRGGMQVRALTPRKARLLLTVQDFDDPPVPVGSVDVPEPYQPNSAAFQKELAARLARVRLDRGAAAPAVDEDDPALASLAAEVEHHPVAGCPEVDRHRRAWIQAGRIDRERASIERQVTGRSASLARQFDRVLQLLESWEYLDGWSLTERGERLARLYHEADLLVAECIEHGVLDELDPPTLAGVSSVFTYEARGAGDGPPPWFPTRLARERWAEVETLHAQLNDAEERLRLAQTRAPDPGFLGLAHGWAAGDDLGDVLEDEDLSGGDFVRNVKQLIDLLRQIGDVAKAPDTRRAARDGADALFRGVVSASSALPAPDAGEGAP
jgi:ATP-dependent RNA helicase HelY